MATRQSVLALYNAVTEDLTTLDEGANRRSANLRTLRTMAADVVGLTGSAGERGWYGELLRYFDAHRTGTERVTATSLDAAVDDLTSEDGKPLPPSWAYRAIVAAYVLDQLTMAGVGAEREPNLLARMIAAAPSEGPGFNDTGKVGEDAANEFAATVLETPPKSLEGFCAELRMMSGALATAVASLKSTSGLRKVKQEYCSVVTTTAEWPNISYGKLKSLIEPVNWSKFYQEFFCEMQVNPPNEYGWLRILESVSGDCDRYTLDTALKFWKQERSGGLFLNYDLDFDDTGPNVDNLVLVDNGYIWIKPIVAGQPDKGVKVRTSKQLLISGMSATAMTKLAESFGWATNATDMFHDAAKYPGTGTPFSISKPGAKPLKPDTATTWPVIVPKLPADLRDEYCADTTQFVKNRLTFAGQFVEEFTERWKDGLDLAEIDQLNDMLIAEAKTASKQALDAATENFRPKAPTP
ncbi:hypothetical protein [Mycolicibacterium pulveris]|uniref:hypothetical protein n=1 Tax=Mycolicibacterium pulveris TaxID=36813 RepID=UPI003CEABCE6